MLIRSPNDLALFVTSQRKKLKLSQTEVGNLVGLKQTTISAFENKPESTKLDTLYHILSAMNLDLHVVPKNKENDDSQWNEEW